MDLSHYGGRISNLDVLILEDEKTEAKACFMEARIKGHDPIAVRARAHTFERAIDAGAKRLESLLAEFEKFSAETVDWVPESQQG
jgi:hypothetical protein